MLAESHNMVILRIWATGGIISFLCVCVCVWRGRWQGVSLAGFLGTEPIVTQLCELKAFVTWGGRVA